MLGTEIEGGAIEVDTTTELDVGRPTGIDEAIEPRGLDVEDKLAIGGTYDDDETNEPTLVVFEICLA